ncbi:MAG TPA: hypothetical protein VM492_02495, partial [Sumerlaeia bacterium]|nr:hypothetical protein [Sumerlaeia bacterium]
MINAEMGVTVSEGGSLLSIQNRLAQEEYRFASDSFEIRTNLGTASNKDQQPVRVEKEKNRLVYHFEFGRFRVALAYTLEGENAFFRRALKIANPSALRLEGITLGNTTFARPADETIHYLTFWMAPTVEFIRHEKGGLFTGIENPFYKADLSEQGVALSFEPGLILEPGKGYESEPQFLGVYKKSGVLIEDSARPFRYANGSGHIPIDRNESRAMRAFALDYLAPTQDRFLNINYQFFHPLPQMPTSDEDASYLFKTIDTFADIAGDAIIFKPLHPYTKPDAATDWWNVLPDETTATARRIVDYAASKGISCGFYMGCAAHGEHGNAGGLPFRPDQPAWKKMDGQGRRAPDNCIGCDTFYEWWFRVQDNTIKRYNLRNWSWDPSLGSAMNCYDEAHGHIAGKGAYKGWRRCIELAGRLKESNPGLFIQGFYGTKHFGLWGLKHTDQHEVYNEQTAVVSTHHTQISDDQMNADGLRFQSYWCMRFRFLPTVMGHALAHRMSEGNFDRELVKAWDFYGWRYSVMSALAVSGSVMPAILPYESDLVPGFKEFYAKWTRWAKENFECVPYTEPFGEQVQPGAVDGYARIKGDRGFVFLFNGNPRPSEITFEVGDEINLQEKGIYEFVELYPSDEGKVALDSNGRGFFAWGQKARMTAPPNACQLFELRRAIQTDGPRLLGMAGSVRLERNQISIAGAKGKPGHSYPIRVCLPDPSVVETVAVNGVEQAFLRDADGVRLDVQFSGARYARELDRWVAPNGAVFEFPYHEPCESLTIATTFTIQKDVARLLEEAKPKNHAEMSERIAAWQVSPDFQYSYHNFVCARPDRLWLIVPFTHRNVEDLRVSVNGKNLAESLRLERYGHSFYVDITDVVKYGDDNQIALSMKNLAKREFMGPFLLYPDEGRTEQVESHPAAAPLESVVYTRTLILPGPPRYVKGAKRPAITEAETTGNVTLTTATQVRVKIDLP